MDILITEEQYESLINEMGVHNPKELRDLTKWIQKYANCEVEFDGNKVTIKPPKEISSEFYTAHNTISALDPVINFIGKVYNKKYFDVYQAWKGNRKLK